MTWRPWRSLKRGMDIQRQESISGIKRESRFRTWTHQWHGRGQPQLLQMESPKRELQLRLQSIVPTHRWRCLSQFAPSWAVSIRLSDDGASVFFATFEFEDGDITDNHWYFVNLSNGEMSSLDVPSGHLHTWPSLSRTGDVLAFASNQEVGFFHADRDNDGISDFHDHCPREYGPQGSR